MKGDGSAHKRSRERVEHQEGVRGGRSTHHEEDTKTSSREGPLLVVDACVLGGKHQGMSLND